MFLLEQKLWATGTFAVFTAWREPAKLTSTVQACQWTKHLQFFLLPAAHVLIKKNGIRGSTGDYVAGRSAAYENNP